MVNILGPGHYADTGETTIRPTPAPQLDAVNQTWFAQCDVDVPGSGTQVDDLWANLMLATMRSVILASGATQDADSDDMLREAVARFASGAVYGVDAGTADASVVNPVAPFVGPGSLFDGMIVFFRPIGTNTGAKTLNYNGLGVKAVVDPDGYALEAGDMPATHETCVRYKLATDNFVAMPWALAPTWRAREIHYYQTTDTATHYTSVPDDTWTRIKAQTAARRKMRDAASTVLDYRWTFGPRDAGLWRIHWGTNLNEERVIDWTELRKNGARVHTKKAASGATFGIIQDGFVDVVLAAGDYLEIYARHKTGSTVTSGNTPYLPFIAGWRLRT